MYQKLISNKFFLTAALVSGLVLLLIVLLSPKRTAPTTSTASTTSTGSLSQSRFSLSNLSEEKKTAAIRYYDLVSDSFPFHFFGFTTSPGIEVNIAIFHFEDDPSEVTRFEITGLSYLNKNELDPSKNRNVAAFKEGYLKGLSLLREAGIDPKQLIFVYGSQDYVQATASYWVDKLGLLK